MKERESYDRPLEQGDRAPTPDEGSSARPSRLIERLTPGVSGPIVVFFPPVLGEMVGYSILIGALRDDAQVFGLRQPLDVRSLEPDFFGNLGARYAEVIKAQHFSGPVFFVGWSMGAFVAYETAGCLTGSSFAPASVVLIDPSPMEHPLKTLIPDDPEARERFVWDFYLSAKLYPEQRARVLEDGDFWTLQSDDRHKRITQNAPQFTGPFEEFFTDIDGPREYEFVRSSTEGFSSFDAKPYEGDCRIVCCKQFRRWTEKDWPVELVPNRHIISVDGDHHSIMFHFSIDVIRDLILGWQMQDTGEPDASPHR